VKGADNSTLFKHEQPQTPYEKLSRQDFGDISADSDILVLRKELDFQRLMECAPQGEPRSSQDADVASLGSIGYVEYADTESEIGNTKINASTDRDSSLYLMELTSPGLVTPSNSLSASVFPRTSILDIHYEIPSNSSTSTLMSTESSGTQSTAADDSLPMYKESSRDKTLPQLPPHEVGEVDDGIPKYWRSELEKTLPELPYEIAPGVVAV
jgi:hypothetical protein